VADLLRAYPGRARSRGAGVQPGVAASGRASGAPPRAHAHPGVQMMGDALDPLAVQPPVGYVAASEDAAAAIAFLAGPPHATCRVRWSTWTAAGPPSSAPAPRAGNGGREDR